ncbi:MAG: glycine oxidase ThiO [Agitococcus sp.]
MKVLIIGSGVIGLLTAFKLAKAGYELTILEKKTDLSESSWAGGGIVSPMYPWRYPPAVSELAKLAQAEYPLLAQELLELTNINIELNQCGMLMLNTDDKRDASVWANQYQQKIHYLKGIDIAHLAPYLAGFNDGVFLPNVANVRNPRLLQALHNAVKLLGVQHITQAEVCQWHQQQGQLVAVTTTTGQCYEAESFVVATGAWSGQLLQSLQVDIPIKPMKGQMLLYKLPQQILSHIVLHQGHYLIPRQDGHILCGSTLEDVGFNKQTTDEAQQLLSQSAQRIMPLLAQHQPIKQWAGLRPASPNGIPFIGKLPQYSNVWLNAGQFRNGLVLAPASAQLLVDLMQANKTQVDASPYQII